MSPDPIPFPPHAEADVLSRRCFEDAALRAVIETPVNEDRAARLRAERALGQKEIELAAALAANANCVNDRKTAAAKIAALEAELAEAKAANTALVEAAKLRLRAQAGEDPAASDTEGRFAMAAELVSLRRRLQGSEAALGGESHARRRADDALLGLAYRLGELEADRAAQDDHDAAEARAKTVPLT